MTKPVFSPFAHSNAKHIIFDLGGVILNINYQLTIDAFKKLGIVNFEALFTQAEQIGLFDQMDTGEISPQEFRHNIRKLASMPLSDEAIDDAWNALLLDLPPIRINLLKRVKEHYQTFLLSNTNAIHMKSYNQMLQNTFGLKNLSSFFNKEYYSHLIHMRKPHAEAFEIILRENDLQPHETIFIDDSIQHVEGAKKLGILAYHLNIPKGESIEQLFT